jgi:hypothetical protein
LFNLDAELTPERLLHVLESQLAEDTLEMEQDSQMELKSLWSEYLTKQGQVSSNITMETLRRLLEKLSSGRHQPSADELTKRIVPGYLTHTDSPNLIVCEASEQIRVALSLYALNPEAPAPTNDEIIYCSSETTGEELENFIRLAYTDESNNHLYTVMNVQELAYEPVGRVEQALKQQQQQQRMPEETSKSCVHLVFICTKEKSSFLASLLAKQRIQPILLDENTLAAYMSRLLAYKHHARFKLRVLTSNRSGNGKSKYVKRFREQPTIADQFQYEIIRIKQATVNLNLELEKLMEKTGGRPTKRRLIHIDIAYEVFNQLDSYLFSLALMNFLKHSKSGLVWRREHDDIYLIEITPPKRAARHSIHAMLAYLPTLTFRSPQEYHYYLTNAQMDDDVMQTNQNGQHTQLGDNLFSFEFAKEKYQRVCFYLKLINDHRNGRPADLNRKYEANTESVQDELGCLDVLINYTVGIFSI